MGRFPGKSTAPNQPFTDCTPWKPPRPNGPAVTMGEPIAFAQCHLSPLKSMRLSHIELIHIYSPTLMCALANASSTTATVLRSASARAVARMNRQRAGCVLRVCWLEFLRRDRSPNSTRNPLIFLGERGGTRTPDPMIKIHGRNLFQGITLPRRHHLDARGFDGFIQC